MFSILSQRKHSKKHRTTIKISASGKKIFDKVDKVHPKSPQEQFGN